MSRRRFWFIKWVEGKTMDQKPPLLETPPAPPPPPATSLVARLLNIFATPGEVFEEVKRSAPAVSNWLAPTLLMGIVGAIAAFIILSQPAMIQQIHEQQQKAMDQQVKAGKMTQEQADKALDTVEKFSNPAVMKIFGAIGAMVSSFVGLFGWAFVLWLIGKFLIKAPVQFLKMAEVAGLASVIVILEIIVKMLLVVSFSNPLASPSLAMLMKDPDPHNKLFMVLSWLDVMTIWALAIRALGLAKLTGVRFGRAAWWVFGTWFLLMSFWLGVGSALQAVFAK